MTDANTFLDDKVPTRNRTALLSVSGTRFPGSACSSTKRIIRTFAPFFDGKTEEYVLRMPRRVLLGLFQGKCVKCGFTWSKNHKCSDEFFIKKGSGKDGK